MATKTQKSGGSTETATAKKSKKTEIVKPEKVLREGLQKLKEMYEAEDWRFTEDQNDIPPKRWTATNGSPAFPKLFGESLSLIFSRIENLKSENGDRLRNFIENHRDQFDAGELPLIWRQEKAVLEASGWRFDYNAEKSQWTGTHADCLGATGVSDFGNLLGIIQRNIREKSEKNAVPDQPKIEAAVAASNSVDEIDLLDIVPSPFEGQKRRRARFTDEEISELANSIKTVGVLQPIVVRIVNSHDYEIIAGERRFLAAQKAGLETIPAVIKNVSDQVAFEIQTIENLQRKDPDPLDEAFSYKEYIEKYGMSENDLSVKFGKPLKFIFGRLKFNDLIPEALEQIAAKRLPLGHAFEISKYSPEAQKIILKKGVYSSLWVGSDSGLPNVKGGAVETVKSFTELKQFIKREILHNLDAAPFSKKATNLRPDGLPCVACPQRTNARLSLFEEDNIAAHDNCLNPACFSLKLKNHIELKVQEITAEEDRPAEEVVYITTTYESKYNGRKPLSTWQLQEIKNKKTCDSMQKGVFIDGTQTGQVISLCQDKSCSVHWNLGNSGTQEPQTAKEKEAERLRKAEYSQDDFEKSLRTQTRRHILSQISSRQGFEEEFLADDLLMTKLVSMVFDEFKSYGSSALLELCRTSGYELIESDDTTDEKPTGWEDSILKLDHQTRLQLLFLSLLNFDDTILPGESIIATKNLASRFNFDYRLIEAETLLLIAPDEFKPVAKDYFDTIQKGENAPKPCFYFGKQYPDHPVEDDEDLEDVDENSLGETSQG